MALWSRELEGIFLEKVEEILALQQIGYNLCFINRRNARRKVEQSVLEAHLSKVLFSHARARGIWIAEFVRIVPQKCMSGFVKGEIKPDFFAIHKSNFSEQSVDGSADVWFIEASASKDFVQAFRKKLERFEENFKLLEHLLRRGHRVRMKFFSYSSDNQSSASSLANVEKSINYRRQLFIDKFQGYLQSSGKITIKKDDVKIVWRPIYGSIGNLHISRDLTDHVRPQVYDEDGNSVNIFDE